MTCTTRSAATIDRLSRHEARAARRQRQMIGGASTASTGAVEVNARGNVALAPCADTTTSTVPAGLGAFVAVIAVATARAGLFSPTGTLRA